MRGYRAEWVWRDKPRFDNALDNPETKAGLLAVARNVEEAVCGAEQKRTDVATEKIQTLGAWGEAAPTA